MNSNDAGSGVRMITDMKGPDHCDFAETEADGLGLHLAV